jgi:hypothetical protein
MRASYSLAIGAATPLTGGVKSGPDQRISDAPVRGRTGCGDRESLGSVQR